MTSSSLSHPCFCGEASRGRSRQKDDCGSICNGLGGRKRDRRRTQDGYYSVWAHNTSSTEEGDRGGTAEALGSNTFPQLEFCHCAGIQPRTVMHVLTTTADPMMPISLGGHFLLVHQQGRGGQAHQNTRGRAARRNCVTGRAAALPINGGRRSNGSPHSIASVCLLPAPDWCFRKAA
jgi:hypothetical protein